MNFKGFSYLCEANQQEERVHLWKTTTEFHLPHQSCPTFTRIVKQNKVSLFSAVVKEEESVDLNDVGVEEMASSYHICVSKCPANITYAVLFTAAPLCYF